MERVAELLLRDRQRQGQGACSTSGSPGPSPTPRSAPTRPFQIPSTLAWTGQPAHLERRQPGGQHRPARRRSRTTAQDVGVAARLRPDADLLRGQGRATRAGRRPRHRQGPAGRACWQPPGQPRASRSPRRAADYNRFDDLDLRPTSRACSSRQVTGTMPNGDAINSGSTFLSIRSFYKNDPDWPKVQAYLNGGSGAGLQLPPVLGAGRHRHRPGRLRAPVPERLTAHAKHAGGGPCPTPGTVKPPLTAARDGSSFLD